MVRTEIKNHGILQCLHLTICSCETQKHSDYVFKLLESKVKFDQKSKFAALMNVSHEDIPSLLLAAQR